MRSQTGSTHGLCSKNNIENAVSFISSLMARKEHGHMFFSNFVCFHWNKSFNAQMEMVENVKVNWRGQKRELCKCLKLNTRL